MKASCITGCRIKAEGQREREGPASDIAECMKDGIGGQVLIAVCSSALES